MNSSLSSNDMELAVDNAALNANAAADDLGAAAKLQGSQDASGNLSADGLRILFAVDSRFPAVGGAEAQSLKLATRLRESGATVEFVTPRVGKEQPLEDEHLGFPIRRIDYPHVKWLGSLVLMANFRRFLIAEQGRHDILHVHITHLLAAAAGFARKHSGVRVITKISGFYEFEGGVLDKSRRFHPLNALLRFGLRRVDLVQTISEQTREKLVAAGIAPSRILFVPNGIDTRLSLPRRSSDGVFRIGFCGRLREVKGIDVLLKAVTKVLERRPDLPLSVSIAGDGTSGPALRKLCTELGLDERVEWLGMIDDTWSFLGSVDAYVQPSWAEGLPNSVMEAMLASRAVIATDIGGNSDLVSDGENGLLFAPGDADALSQHIESLIDCDVLRQRMADAGRKTIEQRYSMDSVIDQLVDAYRG